MDTWEYMIRRVELPPPHKQTNKQKKHAYIKTDRDERKERSKSKIVLVDKADN